MKIKFLGTNGWYSSKTGNSVCTLVLSGKKAIALDAGDGFQKVAGEMRAAKISKLDIFLSHLHLDHCEGLHTLAKLGKDVEARIFIEETYLEKLKLLLDAPFTAPLQNSAVKAKVKIVPFKAGEKQEYFLPLQIPHAGLSIGFRFEIEGKILAHCLDGGPSESMHKLGKNADVFITECSFRPGAKVDPDWGHLTPEMAATLARDAGAKMLVLTHFVADQYPEIEDRKKAEAAAKAIFTNTVIAYDDQALEV